MTLAQGDGVEADLLGALRCRDRLRVALGRADLPTGDRVLQVGEDVEQLEPHEPISNCSDS